jgi:hypothetical protein
MDMEEARAISGALRDLGLAGQPVCPLAGHGQRRPGEEADGGGKRDAHRFGSEQDVDLLGQARHESLGDLVQERRLEPGDAVGDRVDEIVVAVELDHGRLSQALAQQGHVRK